jgi:hypothetical protein
MKSISRRTFARASLTVVGVTPFLSLWSQSSCAAAPVALDPNDPTAKALGYVADGKAVDAAANPTFKPSQKCATCAQYLGKASDPAGACNIFAGKTVPAAGWCKVWVQKTGS